MSREHPDEEYLRQREYVEYASSPRLIHAGPSYNDFSGRRSVFREHDQYYGPPSREIIYAQPPDDSLGHEHDAYTRQARYYEATDRRAEHHYGQDLRSQEASPRPGQTAADRFLETFVPNQASVNESKQPSRPVQPESQPDISDSAEKAEDGSRYTPPPASIPSAEEPGIQRQTLAAPHPPAPSAASNSARHEDYYSQGRHAPMPGPSGPPRRTGPHRRRDRPHDQRMPSRYHRYMSVARDDPYGRGPSISRSQSKRYEDTRRRIDQQETPLPNAEPAYSRDQSVDQPTPDDGFYQPMRNHSREYVSIQDRLHPYSPPRYRYDERRPPPVYVNEYGEPLHSYELIHVRGDPIQSRGPYIPHHPPARYESEHYQYVPVDYDRSPPQRYSSRPHPEEYVYYEERERPLPRRPVPEPESEYEPPASEVKVESAPASIPDGP